MAERRDAAGKVVPSSGRGGNGGRIRIIEAFREVHRRGLDELRSWIEARGSDEVRAMIAAS